MQGLERNRFALLSKTHHALVDGVAGVDISTVLFDVKPVPEPAQEETEWVPNPEPSTVELLARGVADVATVPLKAAERLAGAVQHPEAAARRVGEGLEALSEVAWNFANPAPDVPLNVEIGTHRRFVWERSELATFKRIKDALGGTVNDVVLAVVTGALRKWLDRRGIKTEGLGAAGAGAGLDPGRGRARAARQPDRGDAWATAGIRRGPGAAAAGRARGDG